MTDTDSYTLGLTRYFKGHNLKAQLAYTLLNRANVNTTVVECMLQIAF
jgi:hypothetical protein